jgi:scyllo-inositol 2-dehydrogenase (NADP+)
LFLFGIPKAVFADIRMTRTHSLVDDYMDILLYYPDFRVRLKAGFFIREAIPSFIIHGKKGSFLKPRGDVQEEDLKLGKKPNLDSWGTEAEKNQGLLHTETNGTVFRGNVPTLPGNYYAFFDGVYFSIVDEKPEPVTAQDGVAVMQIIEAAIQSSLQKKIMDL